MAPFTTATLPLQSWRKLTSLRRQGRLCFRLDAVHGNRARFRAAIKTDAATRAVPPGVARGMKPVGIQLRRQLQALGWTGLHAEPASLAFLDIDCDLTARWACHVSPRCCDLLCCRPLQPFGGLAKLIELFPE